jgi:RNA polymerase sigma-70 factor (ECF subfamily)
MNFEEIIKSNKQNIKNIIRLITKQDNEDLEQEVYLKVLKNADKYEERGSFSAWITTVAKNVSKDYLKSAWFKASSNSTTEEYALETIKDKRSTPEKTVLNLERRRRIISAIDTLKPKLRETIILCEMYGYSYEDAAKKLNCPIGTIKSRIYNAKKELAEKLKDLID